MKVRTYRNDIGLFCTDEYDPILDEVEYLPYIDEEEDDHWYYVGEGYGYLLNGHPVNNPDKWLEDDRYYFYGRPDYASYDDEGDDYNGCTDDFYYGSPSYFEDYPEEA